MFYKRVSEVIWRRCRETPPNFKSYAIWMVSKYLSAFSLLSFVLGFCLGVLALWFFLLGRIESGTLLRLIQVVGR